MQKQKKDTIITIVSVVKNEINNLKQSIPVILSQDINYPFEIFYIDSGSTDGSVEIITEYVRKSNNIFCYRISPEEFHHAKTRNWGMRQGRGDIVVFLGGDAIPLTTHWLKELTNAVIEGEADGVVASYGKQVPRSDIDISNYCRMTFNYGDNFLIKSKNSVGLTRKELYFFSTVNCCINRGKIPEFEFDEVFPVNEDGTLSYKIIENNFKIAYCPVAAVRHSHNYSYFEILKRYFDNTVTNKKIGIFNNNDSSIQRDGKNFLLHAIRILSDKNLLDWFKFFIFLLFATAGVMLGKNYKYFPKLMNNKLSKYGTA